MTPRDLINQVTNGELDNHTLDAYSSPALDYEIIICLNDSNSSQEMPIQGKILVDDSKIYIPIGRDF